MSILFVDLETNSLDSLNPQLVSCAFKIDDEPIKFTQNIYNGLDYFLTSPFYHKIFHNALFDCSVIKSLGINLIPPIGDTMIMAWCLNKGVPYFSSEGIEYKYGLKELEKEYLGRDRKNIMQLCKEHSVTYNTDKCKKDGTLKTKKRACLPSELPLDVLRDYNIADVQATYDLFQLFVPIMDKNDRFSYRLKCDMILVFEKMIRNGVLLDVEYLKEYSKELTLQISEQENLLGKYVEGR